jgi:5-methylcytosine-specific restriction endonuclease McrA
MSKRKSKYLRYLESGHWRDLRTKAFERDGYKCVECGGSANLQGHHVRYKKDLRLVPVDWIISLRKKCHKALHKRKAAERRKNRQSRTSTDHITRLICELSSY